MYGGRTTSVGITKTWVQAMEKRGLSAEAMEAETGLRSEQLNDLDERIPYATQMHLMEFAMNWFGSPELTFEIGKESSPEKFGVVGHVIRSSANLREAANQAVRYSKLMCDTHEMQYVEEGERCSLIMHFISPEFFSIPVTETAFSSAIQMIGTLTEQPIVPLEVHFQYDQPAYSALYEQYMNCPLKFNQPDSRIVTSCYDMEVPLSSTDRYLSTVMEKHANFLMEQMEEDKLEDQVKTYIVDHLPSGDVNIEMVADHMHMSRWTLMRKLKDEGTSFQDIFKQMRKKLAFNYLQTRKFSISEVAFLLGFSEPSTFNRAFKSWSGQSPGEFRKSSHLSPAT